MIELKVGIKNPMIKACRTAMPEGTGSLFIPRSSVSKVLYINMRPGKLIANPSMIAGITNIIL